MKLLKITKFGFYTSIESEKYIAIQLSGLAKYLNAYLLREFGNKDYSKIIKSFIDNGYYYSDKIDIGYGDIRFEILDDIEIIS